MKLDPSKCTVVVVGAWNMAIFDPPWVAERLGLEPSELTAELALTAGATSLRFATPTVRMELHAGRLQFAPLVGGPEINASNAEQALLDVEAAAKKIAEELPVTPLTAFGVNFGWTVPAKDLRHGFVTAPEQPELDAQLYVLDAVVVQRVLVDSRSGVRTTIKLSTLPDGTVVIETNQHRDVRKTQVFREKLSVLDDYRRVQSLVSKTYVKGEAHELGH